MMGTATITFSQTGVKPPVYVVTSLSNPPWETLEMDVAEEPTASANLIFTKQFKGVSEGGHQYKIRIGSDWWLVDESQESTSDDQGNRNNVVYVKPELIPPEPIMAKEEATAHEIEQESTASALGKRKDSSMDTTQLLNGSEPPSIDNKVVDKAQPDEHGTPKSPEIPLLVIEKTDDEPALGDDFGEHATMAQKVAHDLRAADASPDEVVISPESNTATHIEYQREAPLFRHESIKAHDPPASSSVDAAEHDSTLSSNDYTSSSENIHTPSESEHESQDDEHDHGLLMHHEIRSNARNDELNSGLLLSHEIGLKEKAADELHSGPLFSHESYHNEDENDPLNDEEDEFDRAPLLPHETGFSDYRSPEISVHDDSIHDMEERETQHHEPFDDDDNGDALKNGHLDDAPLLPHERDSALGSNTGSEISSEDAHYMLNGRPTFKHETDAARDFFGGSGGSRIFRTGSRESTLPHNLPRSDAEDENLHDPSLEQFPTSREQIFERVKTIGLQIPEDQADEHHPQSPHSVLSQACSSVDLVPTKSYTSLASVPEADNSDDDEEDEVEDLPSPLLISSSRPSGLDRDKQTTSALEESSQAQSRDIDVQTPHTRSTDPFEAESINNSDGAQDAASIPVSLHESIPATPKSILEPPAPATIPLEPTPNTETPIPTTSDKKTTSPPELSTDSQQDEQNTEAPDESTITLHAQTSEDAHLEPEQPIAETDVAVNGHLTTNNLAQQPRQDPASTSFLGTLVLAIFGPVGRLLTACLGERKRMSSALLLLSIGVAMFALYAGMWVVLRESATLLSD